MRHTKRGKGALALPRPDVEHRAQTSGTEKSRFGYLLLYRKTAYVKMPEPRRRAAEAGKTTPGPPNEPPPLLGSGSGMGSCVASIASLLSLRFLQHRAGSQLFARLVVRPARPPRAVLQLLSRLLPARRLYFFR